MQEQFYAIMYSSDNGQTWQPCFEQPQTMGTAQHCDLVLTYLQSTDNPDNQGGQIMYQRFPIVTQ